MGLAVITLHPANLLTMTRLVLSPLLFWLVLDAKDDFGVSWAVFGLGVVMALTDFFDGWAARRASVESSSGAFLDPLVDKVVIMGSGFCLVSVERYWWLPVMLIAVRELGITAWRTRWASEGVSIPARQSAKYKTFVQATAFSLAVFPPLKNADLIVAAALWVAVAFTLVTGVQYIWDGTVTSGSQEAPSGQGTPND